MLRQSLFALFSSGVLLASVSSAATIDDITHSVGSGNNKAVLVVDWNDTFAPKSIGWIYRWGDDAAPTGEKMFLDIVAADPRLFAKIGAAGQFGTPVFGIGYDANVSNGFGVSNVASFDGDGFAVVSEGTFDNRGPVDGGVASFGGDRYVEGWWSAGFWAQYDSATDPFAAGGSWTEGFGLASVDLVDGDYVGLSFAVTYPGTGPDSPVPEPTTLAAVGGAILIFARRRRAAAVAISLASSSVAGAAYTYDANDFAVEVVSSTGLPATSMYNNPSAVLGRPTLKFNNTTNPMAPQDIRRAKLTEAVFNTDAGGNSLITTIGLNTQVTVRMGRPVTDDPNNPFGVDFIVFGNTFFSGGGFGSDATNLNDVTLGTLFAENTKVSVSPDNVHWYRYENGPYADSTLPTNSYLWDSTAAAWTDTESDPTLPVNPALASSAVGMNAATALDTIYKGSAGGTGFDLSASDFTSIQYIRIEGLTGFAGGEVDAIADVHPLVPEPVGLVTILLPTLVGRRRR